MKTTTELLLGGPLLANLTGPRRAAYIRQWRISACIFLVCATAVYTASFYGWSSPTFLSLLLVLLGFQLIYAFVRGETVWQLRARELRYRSGSSKANKEELLRFADNLKRRAK